MCTVNHRTQDISKIYFDAIILCNFKYADDNCRGYFCYVLFQNLISLDQEVLQILVVLATDVSSWLIRTYKILPDYPLCSAIESANRLSFKL
jgi:hypothetical protein